MASRPAVILVLLRRVLTHPWTAWAFLAGSLGLTALAWFISDRAVRLRLHERFELRTDEVRLAIRDRISSYEAILRGGAGLFGASSGVDRHAWRSYVASLRLDESFPGIRGLGFSLLIPRDGLTRHIAEVQAEGFPGYSVRPAGDRPLYSSIIYLEPFDWRNQRAFGYDMYSEPVRREAMDRARDSGRAAASAMVTLVQETEKDVQHGFLIYVPVYRQGSDPGTLEARRQDILGFAYAPFRMRDLLHGILGQHREDDPDLRIRILDRSPQGRTAPMYDSSMAEPGHGELVPDLERTIGLELPGGHGWDISFCAHRRFLKDWDGSQPLLVAAGGLVIDLLLFLAVADLAGRERRTRAAASHAALELEVKIRELHDSEERLAAALHGVGDGVWDWHVPSGAVSFSDGWKAMLGHAPNEVGSTLGEWSSRVHPDDLAQATADVEAHLAGRTAFYRNEHRVRHKDGSYRWILDRGLAIARDAGGRAVRVVGTHTDITERKLAEAERDRHLDRVEALVQDRTAHLEQANRDLADRDRDLRIFASVIEQSPIGILLGDNAFTTIYANGSARRSLDLAPAAPLGGHLLDLLLPPPATEPVRSEALGILAGGGTWSRLVEREAPGGPSWLDLLVVPIAGSDGQPAGLAGIIRDVTRVKQMEIEHQRRSAELMQAAKMAALGTLTAGIGHEISNPANFIALNAPLLRGFWQEALPIIDLHAGRNPGFTIGRMPWERTRALVPTLFDGIDAGLVRIRRIVADLREFSLPDSGPPQPLDANAVAEAALSLTRHALDRATTRLEIELRPGLPPVAGSLQKLEQMLVNLLINACQALPAPDRRIRVATGCDPLRSRVVFTIADEGVGIPAEDLARLGEPFHTTRRERGGTGLGLSIVRRIVQDHGGELAFASRPGHGTTVTVSLPAATPGAASP